MYILLPLLATDAHTQSMTHTRLHTSGTRGMMSDAGVCKYVCECAFVYDCELTHPHMCCIYRNVMIWIIKYNVFVSRFHILDDKSSFWINIHITQNSAVAYVFVFSFFLFYFFKIWLTMCSKARSNHMWWWGDVCWRLPSVLAPVIYLLKYQ